MAYHNLSLTAPQVEADRLYRQSQVCKLLGMHGKAIGRKSLWIYRRKGLIKEEDEREGRELRFRGREIVLCWERCMKLRLW